MAQDAERPDMRQKNSNPGSSFINPIQDKILGLPLKILIFLIAIFVAGFNLFGSNYYWNHYHPDISPDDYAVIKFLVNIFGGIGELIGLSMMTFMLFSPIAKLIRKIPLGLGDLGFGLDFFFSLSTLSIVYESIKAYYLRHPGIPEWQWISWEYMICGILISVMPFAWMIPIRMLFNFTHGEKIMNFDRWTKKENG